MRYSTIAGILTALAALAVAPGVAEAQWSDLGLSGHEVAQLRLRHGLLYACTKSGLYRKVSDTADSTWVMLGFGGQWVRDVLAVSPETLIVAREITGTGADTVAMLRSTDGGSNWSPFQNGFGAGGSPAERRVVALLAPQVAPPIILAAASTSRIGKSIDGGMTWKKVYGGNTWLFLAAGASTVWAGGVSAISTPLVVRSVNGGESWTPSFFGGDETEAWDMAFDPSDTNTTFLGLNGGLVRTTNNGNSWAPLPAPGFGTCTAIGTRAFPPLRLYVNSQQGLPGATFFKTDDLGSSWTPVSFAGSGSNNVRAMLVRSGPATDTLVLGTNSGVLRYVEVELVGVDPPLPAPQLELRAHPNPFRESTTFTFQLPRDSPVSFRVFDPSGREVAKVLVAERPSGWHRVSWRPDGLPSGAYFCELRAGGIVATRRVFIVR